MGTPQCRPGGQSPIKPRRPVRRARRAAKHSTSHTNRGHRYVEPTRQAKSKHDTEPLCAGQVGLSGEAALPSVAGFVRTSFDVARQLNL